MGGGWASCGAHGRIRGAGRAGRGGCRGGAHAARPRPQSTHRPRPPGGAAHSAPAPRRLACALDVMGAAGPARRRGRGSGGCSRGARPVPCALRRAPGPCAPPPPHLEAFSASASSAPGGRGGRGRGRGGGLGRRRGARRSRAPGVSLSLPLQKQLLPGRRSARRGPERRRLLPPRELPELPGRSQPSRGLGDGARGRERRRRGGPSPRVLPARPASPPCARAAALGVFAPTAEPPEVRGSVLGRGPDVLRMHYGGTQGGGRAGDQFSGVDAIMGIR